MKKHKWCLLVIGTLLSALWGMEAHAAPETEERKELVSEVYEKKEEIILPSEQYMDEAGKQYTLESWSLEEETIPGESRKIEKEISYSQVEQLTRLPEEAEIEYQDPVQGYQRIKLYPALETSWSNEQWIPMELPLTFHTYGADFYEIGGVQIPYEEASPGLAGYEAVLLQEAGLSDEAYRIGEIIWDGEAYADENGLLCRNAMASGEKRVRDYQITYGGSLQLPEKTAYRLRSVYRQKESEVQLEEIRVETVPTTEAPAQTEIVVREDGPPSSFSQILKRVLTITVGISALVFLGALLFVGWRRYGKKK